ncbi:MAG: hypothetical protein E7480_02295 [Ruminococcaceae bacterium]|nr:hypothetical protein [Oscillospiraceae bacterium]
MMKNEKYKIKIPSTDVDRIFVLSMGYKKDIFAVFAYNFEPSQYNEILADAKMKSANADEIFALLR